MHVSLTSELETMIHKRVETGMYSNASEVVREALRQYFGFSGDNISESEAAYIRELVAPRLQAYLDGTAVLHDLDDVFKEIDEELDD